MIGLAVHLLLVVWTVLRPLPVAWVDDANLTPLASLRSSSAWQVLGELLVLAPLGVLVPLAGGRVRAAWLPSFLRTAGVSALLATALEFLSSWTPGHVLNVDHILLALVGAGVTHLALVPAGRSLLAGRSAGRRARGGAGRRSADGQRGEGRAESRSTPVRTAAALAAAARSHASAPVAPVAGVYADPSRRARA